jgi:autotransporter-associated beta strand protein
MDGAGREAVVLRFRDRWRVKLTGAGNGSRSIAGCVGTLARAALFTVLIWTAVMLSSAQRLNAQVFDVTNGNSSGLGSLAQAVSDANASGAAATIRIDVPAVNLARILDPLNAIQLTTTVGSSQIILPSSSGDPAVISFGLNASQFMVENGVTLKNSTTNGIYANNIGMTITVNGAVLTGGTADGVQTAGSANISVGPTGTIHSVGAAIRELGGIGGNVQIYIAPGGSVISDTQPAIVVQNGSYSLIVSGLLSGTAAIAGSVGPNSLELRPGFQITGNFPSPSGALILGGGGTSDFDVSRLGAGAQFDGFTTLSKNGDSTWTLMGSTNYSGTTTVNVGTLRVNGSIASSILTTVNPGGTLGGSGTVGNTVVNGGTLAPGSPAGSIFGPLTVRGNLSFAAASTYMIQVSPTNAGRTNVTGATTLGGATVNASFAPGNYISKQYTIISANDGIFGTFGSLVSTNLPPALGTTLSYDANDVYLNLGLAVSQLPGLNGNQTNVANALSNSFNNTGGIPLVFATLTPAGLTQVAGETAAGSQQTTFNAMTQFISTLLDPFISGRSDASASTATATPFAEAGDDASAYASSSRKRTGAERDAYGMITKAVPRNNLFDPRWSVWAAGFGGSQTTDGNAALGSNDTTSRVFGMAAGADYIFSPRTIAGFALAGGGTNFSVANGGSGRSDLFQAGAFVKHTVGAAYVSGALAYGWQDITTDRTVTIAGVDRLHAEFNANAFSGRVESGYRFVMPWIGGIGITPYAAGQFTTFDLPPYAEQALSGANTFALAYSSKSVTDTRSELGVRADKSFAMQNAILILRGRAAWAHDFNPDRAIGATFQTLPGASFVVNGAAQASDSALTTVSAEMKWRNGWSAAATFEGEFSDVTRAYAGKGVVRYAW